MPAPERSAELTTTRFAAIEEFLQGEGVAHTLLEHERTASAAGEARATHRPYAQVAKTIVLHDGTAYVIAAVPASERLDLHKLRDLLGATRSLRLATEEEIARDFPSLEVGAVPPFGPMVPAAEVIDHRLAQEREVICPAGDHHHSVALSPNDLLRLTGAMTADICED